MIKMAVEVGGTFTDLIWIEDGTVRTHKVPSTPRDPSEGVIAGLREALGSSLSSLAQLVHGSTVATNAVIERRGCVAALLTTAGFADVLMLQRQLRPNVYAIACRKPEPLIPSERSAGVVERLDPAGEVVVPLDEDALAATIDELVARERPEAIAVCLLHAYRNPAHEERVRAVIAARHPDLTVILSSEVLPIFREYERASTTAMAAYLVPLVERYVARLERSLAEDAPGAQLFIMQSAGGILPSSGSRNRGVEMLNSGPAAGVIGAVRVAKVVGDENVITLDIGGTSSDICLIAGGAAGVTAETEIGGLPVGMPSIDIANIGAGGGSLGSFDDGGMLQVGPRSAGARPGPACYGHGGTQPALTDALVRLGWIRPHRFLGGRMTLLPERAEAALEELGRPRGRDGAAMAQALVDIGAANVSRGVRLVSVQRGHDPKGYALYGYGGMGPMISALSAEELKIERVVIPPFPGLFSALGLLVADLRRIYRETRFMPVGDDAGPAVRETFARIEEAARREFAGFGTAPGDLVFERALEMRYQGQGYELLAPVELDRLGGDARAYLNALFQETHRARYGTASFADPVEIVTFRLSAHVPADEGVLAKLTGLGRGSVPSPEIEEGEILFRGKRTPCRFAWRDSLPAGFVIDGAAVIEEPTATTLVPPGWRARIDPTGAIILSHGA